MMSGGGGGEGQGLKGLKGERNVAREEGVVF